MIPVDVDDISAEWMAGVLDAPVTTVEVLDRHSGTTGRARVGVTYDDDDGDGAERGTSATTQPASVFVKLAPFDERQRVFVDEAGLGIAEARFYRDLVDEVPMRVPATYHAALDDDGRYVMVLEDLTTRDCRFPRPGDDDVAEWGGALVEELGRLHARFWADPRLHGELKWVAEGRRTGRGRIGRGGGFIEMALEQFGDEMGADFRRLCTLYIERTPEIMDVLDLGVPTLVHGDPHLGNLFIDDGARDGTRDGSRVGFLDWAMLDRRTGVRDVAYVVANSIPTEVRRAHERTWMDRYLETLRAGGVDLDPTEAWEQYRLLAVWSWVSATSTAAVGSRWQAARVGQGGMRRATAAIEDLGSVALLEAKLG